MKQTVTLQMDPTGTGDHSKAEPFDVEAEVIGVWAVHGAVRGHTRERWEVETRGAWVLTHARVGLRLPVEITRKAGAVSFARHLRDAGWCENYDGTEPVGGDARETFRRHLIHWCEEAGYETWAGGGGRWAVYPADGSTP